MAQTNAHKSSAAGKVEISTNGSTWTDISGHLNAVDVPEQARDVLESHTYDNDTAIVRVGKRNALPVTVRVIYTETDADAFDVVRGQFESNDGGALFLRWSPAGGNTGDQRYTTGLSVISGFQYPPVTPDDGSPIAVSFTVNAGKITTSTIA